MPFTDEGAAELGIQPPGQSLLARAGEQLANAPTDIFNTFTRMWYNLGFKDPEQPDQGPVQIPGIPISPPKTTGEQLVDAGTGLVKQLPLLMAGEGAAAAVGKAAEVPAFLMRLAKPAAAFGLQGLTESPQEGAVQGTLGAAFGAAETAPLPMKLLLAGGIGAETARENYQQSQSMEQAVGMGAAMSLMPFFFGGKATANRAADAAKDAAAAAKPQTAEDMKLFLQQHAPLGLDENAPPIQGIDGQRVNSPGTQATQTPAVEPTPSAAAATASVAASPTADNFLMPSTIDASHGENFRAADGRLDIDGFNNDVTNKVQNALDNHGAVNFVSDGGRTTTPITSVENGMLRDSNGQMQSPTSILSHGNRVEISPFGSPETVLQGGPTSHPNAESPPLQPHGPAEDLTKIATGQDKAAMPTNVEGKTFGSTTEATFAQEEKQKPTVQPITDKTPEQIAPDAGPINPNRRLTLKSILHPDDMEMVNKAADKLGVSFEAVYNTPEGDRLGFKFPEDAKHPAYGAGFDVPAGATYKDLKNAANDKIEQFKAAEPVTTLKGESIGTAPEKIPAKPVEPAAPTPTLEVKAPKAEKPVATLQLNERPVTTKEINEEMYKTSKWTHVVDVTDANGKTVGKVRGNVTAGGFEVKGGNVVVKGQKNYQKIIRAMAEKYGKVVSDTDMQPAVEGAWKAVGAKFNEETGQYTLEKAAPKAVSIDPPEIKFGKALMEADREAANGNIVGAGQMRTEAKRVYDQEVATLQRAKRPEIPVEPAPTPELKLSESPSPLETRKSDTGEALPPIREGDLVLAKHPDGESIVTAKVIGPSPEAEGYVRVRMSDGTDLDVKPEEIQNIPKPEDITDPESTQPLKDEQSKVVSYGTEKDFAALEEQNRTKGMKRGTSVGKWGLIDAELGLALGKYIAAPVIAGTVTMAMSDPDHRIRNGLLAALGTAAVMKGGTMAISALMEAHPNIKAATTAGGKVTSLAQGLKNDLKTAAQAVTANPKLAAAAMQGGQATGAERMWQWVSRFMEKNFSVHIDRARIAQAAREQVQMVNEIMHEGQDKLRQMKLPQATLDIIKDYIHGKINDAELMRQITDKKITDAAQLITTCRDGLQNILVNAMPPGELRDAIKDSIGKYVTQSYEFFHNPDYNPTPQQVDAFANELLARYQKNDPNFSMDQMRAVIYRHLQELRTNKELFINGNYGESIGSILLRKDPKLSDNFKDMLGIYKNPLDELAVTQMKLVGAARNAHVLSMIADGVRLDGLKFAYKGGELQATKDLLSRLMQTTTNAADKLKIQKQLNDLEQYTYVPKDARFGRLSETFLDRRMHDGLATGDGVSRWNAGALSRTIGEVNNYVKIGHTVLSPLQFVRQVMSIPLLGIMAKTTPNDWIKAFQTIMEKGHEFQRLRALGVISTSDFVGGVIRGDLDGWLSNRYGNQFASSRFGRIFKTWSDIYRIPDLITRVSAFQREETRLLRINPLDKAGAAQHAIDYANRYAINYGAAPGGIQLLRRLPFVNQYLTFAFEVARITKNLGEDVVKRRDPAAMMALTTLGTVPFIMQQASEHLLSKQDQKDWDMAKDLMPDYSRSNFKIVTGRLPNGNFHYIDFTPLIVHDKWMKMARDVVNGDWKATWADNPVFGWNNTPLLNVATSQMTGQDLHTKLPLNTISERLDSARRELLPTLFGGSDVDRWADALTRNAEGGLGIMSPKTGHETSLGGMAFSYATAMRPYTVNPNYLIKQAIYDAKTAIDGEKMRFNRINSTNASYEVRMAALNRFDAAKLQIQKSLEDKLRLSGLDFGNAPSF